MIDVIERINESYFKTRRAKLYSLGYRFADNVIRNMSSAKYQELLSKDMRSALRQHNRETGKNL